MWNIEFALENITENTFLEITFQTKQKKYDYAADREASRHTHIAVKLPFFASRVKNLANIIYFAKF